MIVVQSIVLYGTMTVGKALWDVGERDDNMELIHGIINVSMFLLCHTICHAKYMYSEDNVLTI